MFERTEYLLCGFVGFVNRECVVGRTKHYGEAYALFAFGKLTSSVNVEKRNAFENLYAAGGHCFFKRADFNIFVTYEREVAADSRKLGKRLVALFKICMLPNIAEIKLRNINRTRESIIFKRYGMNFAEYTEVCSVRKDDACTATGMECGICRYGNVFCVVDSRIAEDFFANSLLG